MKILFIHWRFPCQFQHLAPALAAAGHEVHAIMDSREARPAVFNVATYDPTPYQPDNNRLGWHISPRMRRGDQVAMTAEALAKEGFVPDLIIGHYGQGECLYIQDVLMPLHPGCVPEGPIHLLRRHLLPHGGCAIRSRVQQ
jgi:hypothetical protein